VFAGESKLHGWRRAVDTIQALTAANTTPNMPKRQFRMNGRIIGHYRILEQIGAGAMGEVYRARDERLGRDVALKLIRAASSGNADHLRRFEFEARAAAALNHPNIVAVYDVGQEDGSPYIVCELLDGRTLRMHVSEAPLGVRQTVDYSLQIVQGLMAAHERRIVHRDLKPENLFVTRDGRIKILDFGVAKLQSTTEEGRSVEELTTVTKAGAVIGTVAYMSPEQLRGKAVDHRSDIFSVGGILYEMLTGRRPFRGETEVDTITAVLREDPPEIHMEEARIPVAFRQIVRHCLEKEPEKRFQSARDLAFALENLPDALSGRARLGPSRLPTKVLPWIIAAALFMATVALLFRSAPPSQSVTNYQRLTFDEGTLYSARFSPDYRSVVYGAAWAGRPLQLYSTIGDSVSTQPLNLSDASLLAISKAGELALVLHGSHAAHLQIEKGMLARAPLAGGSPREVLEDVRYADWDVTGELAVVHHFENRDRIEYPIGHVLFESAGWVSHIRFSPQGDKIAFINHPALWDDRGIVCMMDLSGHAQKLTDEWLSADGLAWSSGGKEIWFTGAAVGYTRALMAVDVKRQVRVIYRSTNGMTLQDMAPDGRILISSDVERLGMGAAERNGKTVNISWHDWDVAKDISHDGKSLLFEDASEAAPPDSSVVIRKLDGTPPTQLGEGSAGGLSPDGKWAVSIIVGSPGKVTLLPVGPGQSRSVPIVGLERIANGTSRFLPDGKRLTLNGNEPGHGIRCYVVNLDGGKPLPITPEGVAGGLVSPDGREILANSGAVAIFPIEGGSPRSIPGLESNFVALQWSEDNSAVFGYLPGEIPARVFKVDLGSGRKTFIQELRPQSNAGLVFIAPIVVSRDALRFAFSYYQVYSVLYVMSGLK
jgi:serine/threonine protein kinase